MKPMSLILFMSLSLSIADASLPREPKPHQTCTFVFKTLIVVASLINIEGVLAPLYADYLDDIRKQFQTTPDDMRKLQRLGQPRLDLKAVDEAPSRQYNSHVDLQSTKIEISNWGAAGVLHGERHEVAVHATIDYHIQEAPGRLHVERITEGHQTVTDFDLKTMTIDPSPHQLNFSNPVYQVTLRCAKNEKCVIHSDGSSGYSLSWRTNSESDARDFIQRQIANGATPK